jgi:hypothetical protein
MENSSEYDNVIKELSERWDIENLLKFSELNIQEKLENNASQIWHFTELYHKEKNDYDKIVEFKDTLICNRYIFYKNNMPEALKQGEIEKYYLPKDPQILKMNEMVRKQMWKVNFYDGLRKALEKMQWTMQTYIKSMSSGL